MNHPWQQPIRPMEVRPHNAEDDYYYPVLFIRPGNDYGWEVITRNGVNWCSNSARIREVAQ